MTLLRSLRLAVKFFGIFLQSIDFDQEAYSRIVAVSL